MGVLLAAGMEFFIGMWATGDVRGHEAASCFLKRILLHVPV